MLTANLPIKKLMDWTAPRDIADHHVSVIDRA
jgi:hypothetical protein